jgi:hypothetical protein
MAMQQQIQTAVLVHPAQAVAPHPVPLVVNRVNYATVNPALLHLQNPKFQPPRSPRQVRTNFDLPTLISPATAATPDMVFSAPRDPAKHFFLTHYNIAIAPGAGPRAQWVSLESTAAGYRLTVHLADTTPATLSTGNTRITPGAVRYLITASLQGRVVNWDLTPAASPSGVALTLVLELNDFASRDLLYAAMTDPASQTRLIVRNQLDLALPSFPPPQAYMRATVGVDVTMPFVFSKELDGNVFAGLHDTSGTLPPWNVCAVNWNGRRYTYYQATNQPTQVYFLPDAFKIGRQTTLPRRPDLAITAEGADMASMQMTLSYLAAPVWDPQRLDAARPELQKTLALAGPPSLALFQATGTTLLLNLPSADPATGATLTEQKDALIDLTAGVQGSTTMGVAQFRDIYNALFDSRSALLSGEVRVTIGTDTAHIPFIARIDDMAGAILDIDSEVDTKTNNLSVVLSNAIESPVHIEALSGVICRGDMPIASSIVGMTPAPPTDLAPAGADPNKAPAGKMSVTFAPAPDHSLPQSAGNVSGSGLQAVFRAGGTAGRTLDKACTARLDMSKVIVVADPTATWHAIMRDQDVAPVSRTVTLKLVAATLTSPAPAGAPKPAPKDTVLAVQVAFENGQTATFDATQTADQAGFLNQVVKLSVPMEAFILNNSPVDTYKYHTDVITGDGHTRQGDWVTDNRDTLFIVWS